VALAVCLLFDRRADLLLRELWARLEDQGVRTLQSHTHGHHHPHLSYSVLLEWDLDRVIEALAGLPDAGGFELTTHGCVVFPRGRVALAPSLPAEVAVRQEGVTRTLAATGAQVHRHYQPGQWVPHVSLATRANGASMPVVVKAVADALPLTLRVDRAALVDSATGDQWPLTGIP